MVGGVAHNTVVMHIQRCEASRQHMVDPFAGVPLGQCVDTQRPDVSLVQENVGDVSRVEESSDQHQVGVEVQSMWGQVHKAVERLNSTRSIQPDVRIDPTLVGPVTVERPAIASTHISNKQRLVTRIEPRNVGGHLLNRLDQQGCAPRGARVVPDIQPFAVSQFMQCQWCRKGSNRQLYQEPQWGHVEFSRVAGPPHSPKTSCSLAKESGRGMGERLNVWMAGAAVLVQAPAFKAG